MTPPPQEDYFMEYKLTSTDPQRVVYLGVEVLVRGGKVHTSLYDREEDYPFHIVRYPDWDTVAPLQQHGGVLMGRFVACQEACTYLQDFKESVANVVRRALQRHYPKTLVANVWSRFLHTRWPSGDIRRRELMNWFRRLVTYLERHGDARAPAPEQRLAPIRPSPLTLDFLRVFGVNSNSQSAVRQRNHQSHGSQNIASPDVCSLEPPQLLPQPSVNDMEMLNALATAEILAPSSPIIVASSVQDVNMHDPSPATPFLTNSNRCDVIPLLPSAVITSSSDAEMPDSSCVLVESQAIEEARPPTATHASATVLEACIERHAVVVSSGSMGMTNMLMLSERRGVRLTIDGEPTLGECLVQTALAYSGMGAGAGRELEEE